MANEIERAVPPALPQAPMEYGVGFENQRSNILRLFFNKLSRQLNAILSSNNGGKYIYNPIGSFYDTTDQTAAAINTAYAITFDTTYVSSDVSVVSTSRLTPANPGVYSINFSGQAVKSTSGVAALWLWVSKNGTAIAQTAVEYGVEDQVKPVMLSVTDTLSGGDYVEVMFAVDNTDISLTSTAASSPVPAIPAVKVDLIFRGNS